MACRMAGMVSAVAPGVAAAGGVQVKVQSIQKPGPGPVPGPMTMVMGFGAPPGSSMVTVGGRGAGEAFDGERDRDRGQVLAGLFVVAGCWPGRVAGAGGHVGCCLPWLGRAVRGVAGAGHV